LLRLLFCLLRFCGVDEDVHALVYAQAAGVEADVVVLGLAPVAVGVVLVVDLPLAVLLLQALFHGLAGLAVALAHAGGAVLHVGMDEDVQAVRLVLQDEIRAAADDDARALAGQIADDVCLADVELIRHGHGVDQPHRVGRHGDVEQEAAGDGGVFADLLDELVREAALLCDLVDQLLIVIGDAEFLGHRLADASSAAAKLAADGDDLVCHKNSPLFLMPLLYTKMLGMTMKNFRQDGIKDTASCP